MARAKKKVTCQDCTKTFSCKGELRDHRRQEHSRSNVCPICKRVFQSEKRLKMHSQFHNAGGEYECFYCPKQFNKGWKMKIHLVNHSGRPSYVCEYCGVDFLYPGKIVLHLKRMHDVAYACKDCGHAIPYEYGLSTRHKCRIYGCKDCISSFPSKAELAEHVDKYDGKCSQALPCLRPEESSSSLNSPSSPSSSRDGFLGMLEDDEAGQEPSLGNGNGREEDHYHHHSNGCESPEPELVVVETLNLDAKTNSGIKWRQLRGKSMKRGRRASRQGSRDSVDGEGQGRRENMSCGAGGAKESCKDEEEAYNTYMKEILSSPSQSSCVSTSPAPAPAPAPLPSPIRCSVPHYSSEEERDNFSEWTLVVQGPCVGGGGGGATVNASVIGSVKSPQSAWEEEIAKKKPNMETTTTHQSKEVDPPSYFSSILLRSPSKDLRGGEETVKKDKHRTQRAESEDLSCTKETDPPSYFSSILLTSPGRDRHMCSRSNGFKVPDVSLGHHGTGAGVWKKANTSNGTMKAPHRKQDELDRVAAAAAANKKNKLLNTLQLYMDTDAKLTQRSRTSFKSWLTSDSFSTSSPDHDYVFGFEASLSVGGGRDDSRRYYFNTKLPKKAEVDMTFEDLCLF